MRPEDRLTLTVARHTPEVAQNRLGAAHSSAIVPAVVLALRRRLPSRRQGNLILDHGITTCCMPGSAVLDRDTIVIRTYPGEAQAAELVASTLFPSLQRRGVLEVPSLSFACA